MPFISTEVDMLPEASRFIVRLLMQKNEALAKEEIINLVSPLGLPEVLDGNENKDTSTGRKLTAGELIVDRSINELLSAGVVEVDDNYFHLTPSVFDHFGKWEDITADDFSEFLFKEVISKTKTKDLKDSDAGDLASAFAFLLHMPNSLQQTEWEDVQKKQEEVIGLEPDKWPIRNQTQFRPVITWAQYFNFSVGERNKFFIDPSGALEKPVSEVLKKEMPIEGFLDKLGEVVLFTDSGEIGKDMGKSWKRKPRYLSPGLALALKVLHLQKKIKLTTKAGDVTLYWFVLEEGKEERFSHIAPGEKS